MAKQGHLNLKYAQYSMPADAAAYQSPPFYYRNTRSISVAFETDTEAALQARGILYAPDYVINGGGVICVAGQIFEWNNAEIERRVRAIADRLAQIFNRAEQENAPTNAIADRIAEERISAAGAKRHAAE